MTRNRVPAWLFALFPLVAGVAWAEETPRAHAVQVQEAPLLDGLLDDPV